MENRLNGLEFKFYTPKIHKSTHKGKRLISGYASTSALDRQDEIIAHDALKAAAEDLLKNPTVFYEHKHDQLPIGLTVKSYVDSKGLKVVVQISEAKHADNIWQLIKEGILNSFSIGGKVLEAHDEKDKDGKSHNIIDRIELYEVSIVGLPANPEARFEMAKSIGKTIDELDLPALTEVECVGNCIIKAFKRKGGEKVTKEKKLEKDMVSSDLSPEKVKENIKSEESKEEVRLEETSKEVTEDPAEKELGLKSVSEESKKPEVEKAEKVTKDAPETSESDSTITVIADGDDGTYTGDSDGTTTIEAIGEKDRGEGQGQGNPRQGDGGTDVCVCPACGTEIEHVRGVPCNESVCPNCGEHLIGKAEEIVEEKEAEKFKCTKCDWEGTEGELVDGKCPKCGADVSPVYPEEEKAKEDGKYYPYYYYYYDEDGKRKLGRRPYYPKYYPYRKPYEEEKANDKYDELVGLLTQLIGKLDKLITSKEEPAKTKEPEQEPKAEVIESNSTPENKSEEKSVVEKKSKEEVLEDEPKEELMVEKKPEDNPIEKKTEEPEKKPERKSVRVLKAPYGDENIKKQDKPDGTTEKGWKTYLFR